MPRNSGTGLGIVGGVLLGLILPAVASANLTYGSGWYTNLCGSGYAATSYSCPANCSTSGGFCTSGTNGVVRYICDGETGQCRDNESGWGTYQDFGGVGCGKSVQIDVFDRNCRATGGWDPSCNLQGYMVWYSGNCSGGGTPSPPPSAPPAPNPWCGDGVCNGNESCSSCPGDCGVCPNSRFTVEAFKRESNGALTRLNQNAAAIVNYTADPRVCYQGSGWGCGVTANCMSGGYFSLPIQFGGSPCGAVNPGGYSTKWYRNPLVGGVTYSLSGGNWSYCESGTICAQDENISGGEPYHFAVYDPPASCTIVLNPGGPIEMVTGPSLRVDATVTAASVLSAVSEIRFSSTGVVNSSPQDTSPLSGYTNISASSGGSGTVTAQAIMNGSPACSDTANVTVTAPSGCSTFGLSPDPLAVIVGGAPQPMNVTYTMSSGTISQVRFTSSDPAKATVTSPDSVPAFSTSVTGVGAGIATVTATGYDGAGAIIAGCQDTATANVSGAASTQWFQTVGGDVTAAGGDINVDVPAGEVFSADGVGGTPGVAAASGGTVNFSPGEVSSQDWVADNSSLTGSALLSYVTLKNNVLARVTPKPAGDAAAVNTILSGAAEADGYYYIQYSGSGISDLNVGTKKAVILVDGSLTINGQLQADDAGSPRGFLLLLVGGNVTVNGSVGEAAFHTTDPELMGLYFAGGSFDTGSGDYLYAKGSLVANGGFQLRRNTGDINPAEYFEFDPWYVVNIPASVTGRDLVQEEVAP